MSPVLVTGGSGYLGTQLIAALLRDGRRVRATVRSLEREGDVRAAVRHGGADDSRLEVVAAELTADEGWAAAAAGCEEVHHTASPMAQPDDPDEVIVPARDGTLRVLRAARDAGVRRVVLTLSFAAVGYSPKPGAEYTEADWTDPDTPGLPPYPRSKTIAERTGDERQHLAPLLVDAERKRRAGEPGVAQVGQVRLRGQAERPQRPPHRVPDPHDPRGDAIPGEQLALAHTAAA